MVIVKMRLCSTYALLASALALVAPAYSHNSTYTNPIFPGWNSDPTCVFVRELDETFFCATSTFLVFPGLPIYASKDLKNWKHISNALHRPSQFLELADTGYQQGGIFAPTLRYHKGTFYLIDIDIGITSIGVVFKTSNPYDESSWSDPLRFNSTAGIDADLFWEEEGDEVIVTTAGINQSKLNLVTGEITDFISIWNGTGERNPEGPHIYKKDGYYYLMIAEGGTETNHSEVISRSKSISGPFDAYAGNPILTARNTSGLFQTVGHADLFQDASGNWWGVALSTRSGPEWINYPMGRETVLFPVTWDEGQWPVVTQVKGQMSGWALPPETRNLPGNGPFLGDPDVVDFEKGSVLPRNFLHWRFPQEGAFVISPEEKVGTLKLIPSAYNLTAFPDFLGNLTLVVRKQTHTLFDYSVDMEFTPRSEQEEAGVTVFLTQQQHIDMSVILLK
jgi:beta-xylosidase